MKLAIWLTGKRQSRSAFAKAIGTSAAAVTRYCLPSDHADFRIPERDIMARICAETNDEVQPNDFYDLPNAPTGAEGAGTAADQGAAPVSPGAVPAARSEAA